MRTWFESTVCRFSRICDRIEIRSACARIEENRSLRRLRRCVRRFAGNGRLVKFGVIRSALKTRLPKDRLACPRKIRHLILRFKPGSLSHHH